MSAVDEVNAPSLTIVIPTWNGWELLKDCLHSLAAQTCGDFSTVVVDDGSTDDTPARLEETFPHVHCIVSPVNRGFAPTANLGLAAAASDWVFLLNNDVTLDPMCIEKLMAKAQEGRYSMICPLVLCADDPTRIYSAGDTLSRSGRPESLGYKMPLAEYEAAREPFGVSGGYGLFRKTLLDEVGLLDESFVAYFEDSDLCFRARWAGHAAAIVPEARAYHIGSASIAGRTWWRTRKCYQNHALLVWKNYSLALLLRNFVPICGERIHQGKRLFQVARHEWGALRATGVVFAAWWGLMLRCPGALRARHRILGQRRIHNDAMQALLDESTSQ